MQIPLNYPYLIGILTVKCATFTGRKFPTNENLEEEEEEKNKKTNEQRQQQVASQYHN